MIIEVVAGLIRDGDGLLLTVRKRGTATFMLPGGKRDPGEDDLAALTRELGEELGCVLETSRPFGVFEAPAANEPGANVRSHVYAVEVSGALAAQAEIEELLWIDPASPPPVRLAPLLETRVLPVLRAQASETK